MAVKLTLTEAIARAKTATRKLPLDNRLLEFLYANSRFTSMSRSEWEHEVRFATTLQRSLTPLLLKAPRNALENTVEPETCAVIVRQFTSAPTMALGFHGGFPLLRLKIFEHMFPDGVIIASSGKHAARDSAFALFAAREALLKGHPVLMAPDGRFGKETGTMTVLGAERTIADGAPFLAYATQCKTAWFDVVRTDDGFTLETAPGPQREEGESFPDFRERFYRYYAGQIEAAFTGDPRNLAVNPNWVQTFNAMFAGQADRYRRTE